MPSVNIVENKDNYRVAVAAPGLKKEDFKIDIDGNVLTISSEKEEEKKESEEKYTRREYSYSAFSRSFTLPEDVNKEAIEARYADGVLNISLPRKEEAKKASIGRQIKVN
jgi:HSP20 family protein